MNPETFIALGAFIVVMLVQSGMMFFWGGQLTQRVKDHDRRLAKLEH